MNIIVSRGKTKVNLNNDKMPIVKLPKPVKSPGGLMYTYKSTKTGKKMTTKQKVNAEKFKKMIASKKGGKKKKK